MLPAGSSLRIVGTLGEVNMSKGGRSSTPAWTPYLLEDLLKEQALFSWSRTLSARVSFQWQVIHIMLLESLVKWNIHCELEGITTGRWKEGRLTYSILL